MSRGTRPMERNNTRAVERIARNTRALGERNTRALADRNNTRAMVDGNNTRAMVDGNNTRVMADGNNTRVMADRNNTRAMADRNNTRAMADRNNTGAMADRNNTRAMADRNNTRAMADRNNTRAMADRNNTRAMVDGNNTRAMADRNNTRAQDRVGAATQKLYPDLHEFYHEGVVETGSSLDLPFTSLVPTAPPPSESHFDLTGDVLDPPSRDVLDPPSSDVLDPPSSGALDPPSSSDVLHLDPMPEEPALDYTMDYTMDLEPDYDLDDEEVERLAAENLDQHLQRLNLDRLDNHHNLNGGDDDQQGGGHNLNHHIDNLNNLDLNASEKKLLHDKNIEVPEPPRDTTDFGAWMTWRLQANKLLAALILIRQGRRVHLRRSDIRRKPLTHANVATIVQDAKGSGYPGYRGDPRRPGDRAQMTSLPNCPYIMYGIPRVKIATATATKPKR